ncbi:hypothetical protein ZOSMA_89G00280 [Zostera marina]|uniref:MICOS complex subunit Mic10 n=1 Tax=Zostera marina TaxID=29655 RepID=A0A0K9NKE0_ZOSMR|nr:hypothetical protein ZOSMA_89G00280 [Zostera marina]
MAEEGGNSKPQITYEYDLDAKWDACLDLSLRRIVYSSLAGALGSLVFFRRPASRWASVALGAGIGIGSAYTECSYLLNNTSPKWADVKASSPKEEE